MVPSDEELEHLRAAVDGSLDAHEAYVAYLLAIAQFQEACQLGSELRDFEADVADTRYELDFQLRRLDYKAAPLAVEP